MPDKSDTKVRGLVLYWATSWCLQSQDLSHNKHLRDYESVRFHSLPALALAGLELSRHHDVNQGQSDNLIMTQADRGSVTGHRLQRQKV